MHQPSNTQRWVGHRPIQPRPGPPAAMEIPELVELMLSKLQRPPDLLSMACTAKRYADIALKLLWDNPDFEGDPLKNMAVLFPDSVSHQLLQDTPNLSLRVAPASFTRFDYYAKFVRHLQVWQFRPDKYIASVLHASRPHVTLFPNLESIHLGADSNSLEMAGPYLSDTLRTVRVNHWDPGRSTIVHSTTDITASLIKVFTLPELECLDLLDTRLPTYESNVQVMNSLRHLIPQLIEFYSVDLTTLRPIFAALAHSDALTGMFLDLSSAPPGHCSNQEIVDAIRHLFRPLEKLILQCAGPVAKDFVEQTARGLRTFEFKIEGSLDVAELAALAQSLKDSIPTLRVLRCSTTVRAESTGSDTLVEALTPLLEMRLLRKVSINITVLGAAMFQDDQVEQLFRSWPVLCVFSLESDPDLGTPIGEDDPEGFGLTLQCLLTIHRCCPYLYELSLPFLDASSIPELQGIDFVQGIMPFEIHLSRCHAHQRKEIKQFISRIWAQAESSFEDCLCASLVQD